MRVFPTILRTALVVAGLLALTGCPRPRPEASTPTPGPTPTPVPTPTPPPYVPNKRLEVGKIFNGLQYRVTLETEVGTTATRDRNEPESYRAELTVKVKVPRPNTKLEDIARLNPTLPEVLPALPRLLETARVSPSFEDLYRLKCNALQNNLYRLDALLTRHNFYDLETLLELEHPKTKRRALLIQSDMDVDTDGSDIERVPVIEGASSTFQPFTSYRWPRKTETPSPFSIFRENRIRKLEEELATSPAPARKDAIKAEIAELKVEIADLKRFSFLVGQADPFIVMPLSMVRRRGEPFGTGIGDFCVVIHNGVLYPAIVGDAGPTNLMGEASMRICKQILPKANAAYRAASDLTITYLVFPGTAERPFTVPDLARWRARCAALLEEMGGHRGELFTWEDLTTPPPPTTPAPATPAPGTPAPATPAPSSPAPATPTASPAPKASPAKPAPAKSSPAKTSPAPAKSTPAASPSATPAPEKTGDKPAR